MLIHVHGGKYQIREECIRYESSSTFLFMFSYSIVLVSYHTSLIYISHILMQYMCHNMYTIYWGCSIFIPSYLRNKLVTLSCVSISTRSSNCNYHKSFRNQPSKTTPKETKHLFTGRLLLFLIYGEPFE